MPFLAPLEVHGRGPSGSLTFDVEFGYSGDYALTVHGLALPDVATASVANDPLRNYVFEPDTAALPPSVRRFRFDAADDLVYLRVSLFDSETDGDDDLDLYVYYCPGQRLCSLVGVSGENSSDEQLDVLFPDAGEYFVDVHGFRTDDNAGGPGANFSLFVWTLGQDDDRGNLSVVAPAAAVAASSAGLRLSWQLDEAGRWLGGLTHADGDGPLEFTAVTIDP